MLFRSEMVIKGVLEELVIERIHLPLDIQVEDEVEMVVQEWQGKMGKMEDTEYREIQVVQA